MPSDLTPFSDSSSAAALRDGRERAGVCSDVAACTAARRRAELRELLQARIKALEVQYAMTFPDGAQHPEDRRRDRSRSAIRLHAPVHAQPHAAPTPDGSVRISGRWWTSAATRSRADAQGHDSDVGYIATMLGYADTSAFARRFRRWSGTTPSGCASANTRCCRRQSTRTSSSKTRRAAVNARSGRGATKTLLSRVMQYPTLTRRRYTSLEGGSCACPRLMVVRERVQSRTTRRV